MNVFELFAKLGLDTSDYEKGLTGAESKASQFGNAVKVAGGVAAAGMAVVTGATIAGTKAFVDGVSSVAQYGDNIDKMSQKMNLSAEAYQEWDFIMQHCGTSMSSMQTSIKTLSTAAEKGNEAFETLGITQEQIANMSGEELFASTITALQGVEDETQRTYLTSQLLGRGATELGALLNMTAEETAEMKQQAHDLGGVLSNETVKDAARFQDSLQNMQTAFNGVKRSMLSNFLPAFSTVMDGISLVFSGDKESGLGLIENGVKDLADNLSQVAPTFIQIGGTILQSLAGAVADNAPLLIESGLEAVGKLAEGIMNNADGIIDAVVRVVDTFVNKFLDPDSAAKFTQTAVDIIVKLANGLTQALPQMLPAIVEVIVAIVTTLTQPENLNMLIDCSLQLIMAIANGIVEALPELIAVVPTVIFNLVEAIIDNFPEILNTVLYLIGALAFAVLKALGELLGQTAWEITNAFTKYVSKATEFGTKIGNWLRNSKSKVLNGVSTFFTNIGNFFTNGFNNIKNKVQTSLENIKNKFTNIFENVRNVVRNAIEYIRGLFNFEWSLPRIKLPHFSISGKLDLLATPPQIPSVSVEWYKKAMNQAYLLNDATIFGAANGKLLAGGESGSEMVIGTNKLMSMIRQATGGSNRPININIYGAEGQDIRTLARECAKELQKVLNDKEKVYA